VKSLKDVKAQLLANPAVRQAYDAQAPEFELARELIAARLRAGLTQGDVAALMGTTRARRVRWPRYALRDKLNTCIQWRI
jgi:hypothetical protein